MSTSIYRFDLLKIFMILVCIIFGTTILLSQPAESCADNICGEWWTPGNEGKIYFFRSNGKYYGMITWMKNPAEADGKPKYDKHNPLPENRNRPLQNLILFSDLSFDQEKGKYIGGSVYDAEKSGKTYSCWMKLVSHNVLEIHGFLGFSLIGRSEYFTRVQ